MCVKRLAIEPRSQIHSLLHHVNEELLTSSFYQLKKKAAVGVDGVTWHEYEQDLEDRIADLHGRIHRGAFRAKPSKRVYIEKADGPQRPWGSPRWRTRSSSTPFAPSCSASTRRTFSVSAMASGRNEPRIKP